MPRMIAKPCSAKNGSSPSYSGATKTPISRAREHLVGAVTTNFRRRRCPRGRGSDRCPRLGEDLDPSDAAVVGELEGEALGGAEWAAVDRDRLRQLGERHAVARVRDARDLHPV